MARFTFHTNCVDCPGEDAGEAIRDMVDSAQGITRRTFLQRVNREQLRELEKSFGYQAHHKQGLTMARDFHVGYFKGTFRGQPAYFFDYSRIEYIFLAPKKEEGQHYAGN